MQQPHGQGIARFQFVWVQFGDDFQRQANGAVIAPAGADGYERLGATGVEFADVGHALAGLAMGVDCPFKAFDLQVFLEFLERREDGWLGDPLIDDDR